MLKTIRVCDNAKCGQELPQNQLGPTELVCYKLIVNGRDWITTALEFCCVGCFLKAQNGFLEEIGVVPRPPAKEAGK